MQQSAGIFDVLRVSYKFIKGFYEFVFKDQYRLLAEIQLEPCLGYLRDWKDVRLSTLIKNSLEFRGVYITIENKFI